MKKISHFQAFLLKQHFQKSKLKFIEEAVKLQKKQDWTKVNKLILNSSLAFNPQMQEIAGKSWILKKSRIVFPGAFFEAQKSCKCQITQNEKDSNCDAMNREITFLLNILLEYLNIRLSDNSL